MPLTSGYANQRRSLDPCCLLPKLVNGALNIESLGIDDWFGGTHLAGTRVRSAPDHYVSISVGCCSAGSVAVPYTASKMPCAK